ncbi:hypothetical protein [Proteiniborus sp.]|uniref:hypothetical protein n=1 Tax=Proteiniborus sp. TaxID=2079015 RepID=UPI0033238626
MLTMIKLKNTEYGPVVIVKEEFSLTNPNSIHQCNEFLRSLNTGIEIKFENFIQYINLLQDIALKLNILYSVE